jgi:hypothetical protein
MCSFWRPGSRRAGDQYRGKLYAIEIFFNQSVLDIFPPTHPDQGLQPWGARPGWSGYNGRLRRQPPGSAELYSASGALRAGFAAALQAAFCVRARIVLVHNAQPVEYEYEYRFAEYEYDPCCRQCTFTFACSFTMPCHRMQSGSRTRAALSRIEPHGKGAS